VLKQETKVWSVRDLMKVSIDLLEKRGFGETRLNVELLLAHALKFQRIQLYTNFDKPLSRDEVADFRRLLERRLNREPLQYIVGSAGFMGLQFRVDQRVLIPRPETETLVEQVMLLCNRIENGKGVSILEVGTGSGNIAVSTAKYVRHAQITTIDNSAEALEVAMLNAKVHEVSDRIDFRLLDIYEPIDQIILRRFDIFVSNPPYVSSDDFEHLQLEVRKFEPRSATTDGKDGLEFYRRLVEVAPYVLSDGGQLAVEVGYGQAERVKSMMEASGMYGLTVMQDLQSIPRVVIGSCRATTRNPGPLN